MFGASKSPLDRTPYSRSPESRPLSLQESTGEYVFVVDLAETIHVAPNVPHMHPRVLGLAQDALYAGELAIDGPGHVREVTNLSGTFPFDSQQALCCVAKNLQNLGFVLPGGVVRWFPPDGLTRPLPLRCL